jgi:hypothetical protein
LAHDENLIARQPARVAREAQSLALEARSVEFEASGLKAEENRRKRQPKSVECRPLRIAPETTNAAEAAFD